MKRGKIAQLFGSLSPQQVKQLRDILVVRAAAPLVLQKLFKSIYRQYPNLDISLEAKKKLHKKLYPNQEYDDLTIRRRFSELSKIILNFLKFASLQQNVWQREFRLAKIYQTAGQTVLAQKKWALLHDYLEQETMKNAPYWKKKIHLYQAELNSELNETKKASLIQKMNKAADCFFAFSKIRLALLLKSQAMIFKREVEIQFLDKIRQQYERGFLKNDPLFSLYYLSLDFMESGKEETFLLYEERFFKQINWLYGDDRLFLFYLGLNYIVRQVNIGNATYRIKAFKWYQFAVEEDFLILNGVISSSTFSNIVSFGCLTNELKWTHDFVETYQFYLPLSIRKEEKKYSNALIYFHQKEFNKSVAYLEDYSFSQKYILKTKFLLLRSYFELYLNDFTYYQILNNNISAFENYLRRKSIWTEKIKLPYLNACRIIKRIVLKVNKLESTLDIIQWYQTEMDRNYPIMGKIWINEALIKKSNL